MFLARQHAALLPKQAAGLSSLPNAILTRIAGRFKTEEEYKPHVDLELEQKYDLPIHELLTRMPVGSSEGAMVMEQYVGHVPCNGALAPTVTGERLSNGVATVAVDSASPIVHLGVYLGLGTRHETKATAGMLQVMKHAWLGTTTRRTLIGGVREPIQCGANIVFTPGRDVTSITASCPRDKADLVLDHMVQSLICPEFFNHELHTPIVRAAQTSAAELANPLNRMLDQAHQLAYRGTGLGRSLYYAGNSGLDRDACLDFALENFRDSNNIAVVGVGFDADTVNVLADEFLWSLEGGSVSSPPSSWTGMREAHIEAPGAGGRALFLSEGAPTGSKDALTLDLIGYLVGGSTTPSVARGVVQTKLAVAAGAVAGGSFTSECVNISYSDSGMFGLSVTAGNGAELGDVLKSSIGVVRGVSQGVSDEDLQGAKNRLKLSVLNERSSVSGIITSTATEALAGGAARSAGDICAAIDALTAEDVMSVAKKVATSQPVLVTYGSAEDMPIQRELI